MDLNQRRDTAVDQLAQAVYAVISLLCYCFWSITADTKDKILALSCTEQLQKWHRQCKKDLFR